MAALTTCNNYRLFDCLETECLGNILLVSTCLISLLVFSIAQLYEGRLQHSSFGFEPIPTHDDKSAHRRSYIKVISPLVLTLEIIGILADITIGTALLIQGEAPESCPFPAASILFSVYLLLLLGGRGYSVKLNLQSHSACLYAIHCLTTACVIPSLLDKEPGQVYVAAILSRLAIFTALCVLHCTSPRVPWQALSRGTTNIPLLGQDESAGLLSRLTFQWLNGLIWKAYRSTLTVSNLHGYIRQHVSAVLAPEFRTRSGSCQSLLRKIFWFLSNDLTSQGAWATLASLASFGPPVLMRLILGYLESQSDMTLSSVWLCVTGLLLSGVVSSVADCQCRWIGRQISARLRAVLINEVYAKVLKRNIVKPGRGTPDVNSENPEESNDDTSEGNIVNLISVDAEAISEISGNLYFAGVMFPVQLGIGAVLLYGILGISGVLGIVLMMALTPLNLLLSKQLMVAQGRVLEASDARIQASNELLNNIRMIKYCAWEEPFRERVLHRRVSELKQLRYRFIWWSISLTVFYSLSFIMTALTCFLYTVVWRNELRTSIAFPALAMFGVLKVPLDRMADTLTMLFQAHVSLKRIVEFLMGPSTGRLTKHQSMPSSSIGFEHATLAWHTNEDPRQSEDGTIPLTENSSSFKLERLEIQFRETGLNVICGPNGSGKSSLLLALLGEMQLVHGKISLPHDEFNDGPPRLNYGTNDFSLSTAYCPQEPWIMNRSIRNNILFGLPFDAQRYEAVIHAVALSRDISALDEQDETLAGENGSRLSGGQKQRVALARALYSRCKHVLLDDCLSAVDHRTANHIFFYAIKGLLMQGRTCILATHNTQLVLPHCDYIVLLDSGHVKAQDTYENLVSARFLESALVEDHAESPITDSWSEKPILRSEPETSCETPSCSTSIDLESQQHCVDTDEKAAKVDYEESKSEGAVPWSIILKYLRAFGSWRYWVVAIFAFVLQQLATLGTGLWMKHWASQYDSLETKVDSTSNTISPNNVRPSKVNAWYYLTIYCAIAVAYALISCLRDLTVLYGSLKTSSSFYERLLSSVLSAKLLFFDRTPLGQITNRFSKDVEVLDQTLATWAITALQLVASLIMVVLLISIYLPAFLLVAVFILAAYYGVTAVYLNSARDLKRIENVQRSPLYQQFGETITGCVSIRAYALTNFFTNQNHALIDSLNEPYLLQGASNEWLTFRVGFLSSTISFATGAFVLWSRQTIDPGAAGLVLTYAASFTETVLWLVTVYAYIQQDLNSVERIVEYTSIDAEATAPLTLPATKPPYKWPTHGAVRFENYTTSYAPGLDPVLKDLSFTLAPGRRTAIVGRTGAGKSTLALALIRGLEATGGSITLDDIDIASVTLWQLRQAITIVPQDPHLFDGTLRMNLAPLRSSSDDEMLDVLRSVHIWGSGSSVDYADLDRPANTLSRGQRQLLCIARGLLRRSRVLVLDEVTASVDQATDEAVQEGLRVCVGAGTTVLAIAHRLVSVADYDGVVVLDAGRVVEEGAPGELLRGYGGQTVFRRMCEESGSIEEIERVAGLRFAID